MDARKVISEAELPKAGWPACDERCGQGGTRGVVASVASGGETVKRGVRARLRPRLLALLRRRSRTCVELQRAGFDPIQAVGAAGELALMGQCRLMIGPLLISLETPPHGLEVPGEDEHP
jgi:hypothetical protein